MAEKKKSTTTKSKAAKADTAEMTVKDFRKRDSDLHTELFELRLQNSSGQLENTAKIRDVRKNIARVKTYLSVKLAKV